jgi:hypothetical protein
VDLDNDLYGATEAEAVLVYRATPADPWTIYTDYDLSAGNLFSATGNFQLNVLRKGQYAFANGDPALATGDVADVQATVEAFPIPASDQFVLTGCVTGQSILTVELYDMDGKKVWLESFAVQGNYRQNLDIQELAAGTYALRLTDARGNVLHSTVLPVAK